MPHKVIKKEDVSKVKDEMGRLSKAIDRLRIYSNAKDNETVKLVLKEVRILRGAAVRNKNDALEEFTNEGDGKAKYWRGYEKALGYIVDTFEHPDEEIKEYLERRERLEQRLKELRSKHEIR